MYIVGHNYSLATTRGNGYGIVALSPGPLPGVCNIEKLGMGLWTRLAILRGNLRNFLSFERWQIPGEVEL